ncbi:MAG: MotA/TolQ/ExbB proton channel family protein [Candidatus Calescibacterium sp.]|nr:MotA/TolQ/ExbB proton channel family protein [Candidatus Calescibacterium sp.]MDW8086781.1 MotA/TolQ/ExbB proton channel family protein [Candidatus Calescibacterium sp.]
MRRSLRINGTGVWFSFSAVVLSFMFLVGVAVSQEGQTPPAAEQQIQQQGGEQPAQQAVGEPQEGAQAGQAEEKEEKGIFAKLLEAYVVGDWPMHFILLFLILILVLAIERIIAVYIIYGKDPSKIFEEIRKAFEEGGIDRAIEVAQSLSKYPTGSIFFSALKVAKETNPSNIDEKELKELINSAVEEEFLRAVPKIQKRIPLVHIFANTAVLLGLLGAVVGLIEAFAGVGALDPAQRQLYLSKSIAIVMHSTAFGLIAAIIGVVLFAMISSRANNLLAVIEEYAVRTVNWVYLMRISKMKDVEKEKKK